MTAFRRVLAIGRCPVLDGWSLSRTVLSAIDASRTLSRHLWAAGVRYFPNHVKRGWDFRYRHREAKRPHREKNENQDRHKQNTEQCRTFTHLWPPVRRAREHAS